MWARDAETVTNENFSQDGKCEKENFKKQWFSSFLDSRHVSENTSF